MTSHVQSRFTHQVSNAPATKAAWQRYQLTLGALTAAVEASEQFSLSSRQQARAYSALAEVQALTYNFAVAPRLLQPRLFHNTSWQGDIYSIGGNGPDFHYATVFLDGSQTYRLTGQVNDSQLLLAQLNNALPGTPGSKVLANYDFSHFTINRDGSFAIILSADEHPGNWIKLERDAPFNWLLFRPTVELWEQRPADLEIERISDIPLDFYEADEFDDAAIARRITFAADYATYLVNEWMINFWPNIRKNSGGVNIFAPVSTEIAGEVGSPSAEYVIAAFEVDDDEALIFELDEAPQGDYWSFQLQDVWLRSLDFRTRQSALNRHQLRQDKDGKYRIVVTRRDPGVWNWIDTLGYEQGLAVLRHYNAPRSVIPQVRRIRFDELAAYLPADTARLSPRERQEELTRRRLAYLKRQGE